MGWANFAVSFVLARFCLKRNPLLSKFACVVAGFARIQRCTNASQSLATAATPLATAHQINANAAAGHFAISNCDARCIPNRQKTDKITMKVLILTGAGISAESGIPTFRGNDGLWEGHRLEDVATPEAFDRNPVLVHQFYNERRRKLRTADVHPNPAHVALAEFERRHDDDFLLVTQNIDNLHQRAGSQHVLPMHGELLKARCIDSGKLFDWQGDLSLETPHPDDPNRLGRLRPHVVWFGEMPIGLDAIDEAARQADLFVAIGTSAVVYPAAGIVQATRPDCRRVEINLDPTPQSTAFGETVQGKASIEVPTFFETLS